MSVEERLTVTTALIILSVLFYSLANIAIGRASAKGDPNFAGFILNAIGALIPLILYLIYKSRSESTITSNSALWAIIGGVGIGLFTLTLTQLFARGGNFSFVSPLVFGGAVAVVSLAGLVVFHEKTNTVSVLGIIIIAAGILLLSYGSSLLGKAT